MTRRPAVSGSRAACRSSIVCSSATLTPPSVSSRPILVRHGLQDQIELRELAFERGVEHAAEVFCVGPRLAAHTRAVVDKKGYDERGDDEVEADDRQNDAHAEPGQRAALDAGPRTPLFSHIPAEHDRRHCELFNCAPPPCMAVTPRSASSARDRRRNISPFVNMALSGKRRVTLRRNCWISIEMVRRRGSISIDGHNAT